MSDLITKTQLENASLDADSMALFVNGDKTVTVVTRQGKQYPSLAKFLDNYTIADKTFKITSSDPDGTIAGIAGTSNGEVFRVGQGPSNTVSFKYYINASGTAEEIAHLIGATSVTNTIRMYMTESLANQDLASGLIPDNTVVNIYQGPGEFVSAEYINKAGVLEATNRKVRSSIAQVPYSKIQVFEAGVNKFDKNNVTNGYYLFGGTGKPTVNASYCYSDFIPVKPGEVYSSNLPTRVATFYDINFQYVSDIESTQPFTIPANCYYLRVSVLIANNNSYNLTFGVGTSTFKPYEVVLKNVVNSALINLYKSMGFTPGKNLYNPYSGSAGQHISTLGTLFTNSDATMTVSDYIPIDPTKQYCSNQQFKCVAYYDSNGAFISRQFDTSFTAKAIAAFVIPANAAFLRIEIPTTNVSVMQIEQSTLATSFEPFSLKSPNSYNSNPVQYGDIIPTLKKSGLFVSGQNLFDKNAYTYGWINEYGSVFPTQGASGSDYVYSDYIKLEPGAIYTSSASMRFVAFYDANKSFVSSLTSVTQITAPSTASYMRVTILQTALDSLQIIKGKYLPEKKSYTAVIASQLPDGTPIKVPGTIVDADSLNIDFVKHGLLAVGKNLFNYRTSLPGYINESGVIVPGGTSYYYSDFIPVKPNTTYKLNLGARFVAEYSDIKGFVLTIADSGQNLTSITTGSEIYFIRITVGTARRESIQIEEGSASTAFEPFEYSYVSSLPDGTPISGLSNEVSEIPDMFGIERLRETHMRLTKLSYGQNVRLSAALMGDSYTRFSPRYALKVAQKLWATFSNSPINTLVPPIGYGWRSFGFDPNGDNTDIINTNVNQSGFTCAYNTGNGPDISSVTAASAGATISYNHDFGLGFEQYLFFEGGSGTIQYQTSGMASPEILDLTQYPAGMNIVKLSNLPSSGSSLLTFTVNVAPVTLYGVNILNETLPGIIVNKLGGSGSRTTHWVNAMNAKWSAAFTNLAPDLTTIMLGTNDQGSNLTASTFRANLLTMIDTIRAARPTTDILLIIPAENNRPGGNTTAMETYAKVMYDIAKNDRDVAFLNLQKSFGEKPSDYAYGSARPWMIADGLHPDPKTGGYAISSAIIRAIQGKSL